MKRLDIISIEKEINRNSETDFEHFCLNSFSDMLQAIKDLMLKELEQGLIDFEIEKYKISLKSYPYYYIGKTDEDVTLQFKDANTGRIVFSEKADKWEICKKNDDGTIVVMQTGTESNLVRSFYHMMNKLVEQIKLMEKSCDE